MRPVEIGQGSMAARSGEDDAAEFVRQAYLLVLGREADVGGLVNYVNQLRAGASRQDVITSLAESEEGRLRPFRRISHERHAGTLPESLSPQLSEESPTKGNWTDLMRVEGVAFVRAAYCTILGREPDPDGRRLMVCELKDGVARSRILWRMLRSTEYRRRRTALKARAADMLKADAPIGEMPDSGAFAGTVLELYAGPVLSVHEVDRYVSEAQASCKSRSGLAALIRASRPARQRAELIRHIRRAAFGNSIASLPIIGSILRLFLELEGNSPLETRVRRLGYVLEALYQDRRVSLSGANTGARDDAQKSAGPSGSGTQTRSVASVLRTLPAPRDWS